MLILGSTSPRRKKILGFFNIPFEVAAPDFDELIPQFTGDPAAYAIEVAQGKALALKEKVDKPILTADTIVFREGKLYLKPTDLTDAKKMLGELQGKRHTVYTGVALYFNNQCFTAVETTDVIFHPLTESQIGLYHTKHSPFDKSGAYAIQDSGSMIVKRIEGCYYNIMGLPISTTRDLLSLIGIDVWHYLHSHSPL
jgi:septum formation protein